MAYQVVYHPTVLSNDLPSVNRNLQRRIVRAIEQRLATEPTYYGEPLRHELKGYWKLRVGDYRVIYRLVGDKVLIVAIGHRKESYPLPPQRFIWRPESGS